MIDRVHGGRSTIPRDFIKWWPSAQRSTGEIKNMKGCRLELISAIDQGVDGSRHLRPVMAGLGLR
jgi:hypothetical protein